MRGKQAILCVLSILLVVVSCEDSLQIKDKLGSFDLSQQVKVYPADTGYVPYGQIWDGILVLASPLDACGPLTMNINNPNNKKIFILAQRGGCLFVQKADNVQFFGAQALIIADNAITNLENANIMDITENQFFISIMLIAKNYGDKLISAFTQDQKTQVSASLKFDLEEKVKTVDYQYFFSSLQLSSYDFIQNLLNVYDDFHGQGQMDIIFEVYTFLDVSGYGQDACKGKYCALDPDQSGPLKGVDQIMFDLNILCLQEQLSDGAQSTKDFLRYLIDFRDYCLLTLQIEETHLYSLQDCFFKIYEKEKNLYKFLTSSAQFKKNIESCAQSSFSAQNQNPLLDQSYEKIIDYQVTLSPELFINGVRIHGNIGNAEELSDLLCHMAENPPSSCNLEIYDHGAGNSSGKIFAIVFFSILFGVLFILIALFCYRRQLKIKLREDVNETVQSVVSSYMAMHEGK